MISGWEYTICLIEFVDPGLVSKVLLIDPPELLSLVLHGLLWYFSNKQATQGVSFLIFLVFLGIFPLLDSLIRGFKEHWFNMWCQSRISLSPRPQRSLVDHSLDMYSLMSSDPSEYLSTSYKLVGIWDRLLVGVRRSSHASMISSRPKSVFPGVFPRSLLCTPL